MAYSNYTLNNRVSYLEYEINKIVPIPPTGYLTVDGSQTVGSGVKTFTNLPECAAVPTTGNQLVNKTYVDNKPVPPLADVLTSGNTANNSITLTDGSQTNSQTVGQMEVSDFLNYSTAIIPNQVALSTPSNSVWLQQGGVFIDGVFRADWNTITSSSAASLSDVLTVGNSAGTSNIDLNSNSLINTAEIDSNNDTDITINALGVGNINVVNNGNNTFYTDSTNVANFANAPKVVNYTNISLLPQNIITSYYLSNAGVAKTANNLNVTATGSGTFYFPMLTANSGVLPPYSPTTLTYNAGTAALACTSMVATNYQSFNTTQDLTHYLNFSDSSATGTGRIQKSASLYCNPSAGRISATTFVGALTGAASQVVTTSDNTSGLYYIPFSKTAAGSSTTLYLDDTTTALTYNPSTSAITATSFLGNATTATTATTATGVNLTGDDTAGTYYLPFSKTTAATANALYIDNTTTPLTYNPNTSTLTATNFSGTASTSTAITLTSDNTAGTYYIPFSKTAAGTSKSLFLDDTTGPLTYNPSTGVLTSTSFSGSVILPTTTTGATFATSTLTISAGSVSFASFNYSFTGTTNTVSALTLTNLIVNGMYQVALYNGGTGSLTINATGLGTGIKTTYTNAVVVPTLGYALLTISYVNANATNFYIVSVNNVA
jgi:hypothetical protein